LRQFRKQKKRSASIKQKPKKVEFWRTRTLTYIWGIGLDGGSLLEDKPIIWVI
jgi:hypothetical protein